jgi:hypothetical protein
MARVFSHWASNALPTGIPCDRSAGGRTHYVCILFDSFAREIAHLRAVSYTACIVLPDILAPSMTSLSIPSSSTGSSPAVYVVT